MLVTTCSFAGRTLTKMICLKVSVVLYPVANHPLYRFNPRESNGNKDVKASKISPYKTSERNAHIKIHKAVGKEETEK